MAGRPSCVIAMARHIHARQSKNTQPLMVQRITRCLIRQHLIGNLLIGQDDFNLVVIQNAGGTWQRVNRDFGGKLPDVIQQINEAVAAV
jgi:hypothetical protein